MNDETINRLKLLINNGGKVKSIYIQIVIDQSISDTLPVREWQTDEQNNETCFILNGSVDGGIFDGIKFDKNQVERIINILMDKNDEQI